MICKACDKEKTHYAKGLCKPCYMRQWLDKTPDYHHQWRQNNPDKVGDASRRWREAHPKKRAAIMRRWQRANPEKKRAIDSRWRKKNAEKMVVKYARRYALKKGGANMLTFEQVEFERHIGKAIFPGEKLHMHHLVPLTKGGNHSWGNIIFIPAYLNESIGDKLPEQVYAQLEIGW